MPNVGKCQLHVPHKANMVDWATMLGFALFPDDPIKAAQLALLGRNDRENWSALERFLNDVAPQCFGGGGCGTPSSVQTADPGNVVDGEDACAEGRNNTVHGDKSTVIAGQFNENDGENCTISGEDNTITDGWFDSAIVGGSTNHLEAYESVILGGDNNTITGGSNASTIVGGDNNSIDGVDAQAIVASSFSTLVNSAQVAIVGGYGCADDSQEQQGTSLVTGTGGVVWAGFPSLVLGTAGTGTLTSPDGFVRSYGQYQVTGRSYGTEDNTPVTALSLGLLEMDSLFRIHGTILARQTDADVASVWSFDAVVSSTTASGARFVGTSPHITLIDQDVAAALWAVAITIDPPAGVFNQLLFTVTGDAAHEVDWLVRLTIDEEYTGN